MSIRPVIDSRGDIVALLFVDVRMKVVIGALCSCIIRMILISLGVLVSFGVIQWRYMRRNGIGPLMRIRGNAAAFAQNDTATTASPEGVRTRDEIQELAESISRMEGDIVRYIDNTLPTTPTRQEPAPSRFAWRRSRSGSRRLPSSTGACPMIRWFDCIDTNIQMPAEWAESVLRPLPQASVCRKGKVHRFSKRSLCSLYVDMVRVRPVCRGHEVFGADRFARVSPAA